MPRGADNGPRQGRPPASGKTKAKVSKAMKKAHSQKKTKQNQKGVNLNAFSGFTRNGNAVHQPKVPSGPPVATPIPTGVPPPGPPVAPPIPTAGAQPALAPAPTPVPAPAPVPMEEEAEQRAREVIDNRDVQADFDDPDPDDGGPRPDGDEDEEEETPGPMRTYLKAVFTRIKEELGQDFTGEQWMVERLREHSWRLRAEFASTVCEKLEIEYGEAAYYRDIRVWLPDVRWGPEFMPVCGTCHNPASRAHGFQPNHYGRKIISEDSHYFIISRRYYCGCCHNRAKDLAASINVSTTPPLPPSLPPLFPPPPSSHAHPLPHPLPSMQGPAITDDKIHYTFMGYDKKSVPLLPYDYGLKFPAFLTHRAGLDNKLVDKLRPLYNKGVRSEAFSEILLEAHTKRHCLAEIMRENELRRARDRVFNRPSGTTAEKEREADALSAKWGTFSSFHDKTGYNGSVPTGQYIARVFEELMASIRPHLDREVKKRGGGMLFIDASYKVSKHLFQYNGKPMFRALITGTNEHGEIRVQFHVVTDGHDQIGQALDAMVHTMNQVGQGVIISRAGLVRSARHLCSSSPPPAFCLLLSTPSAILSPPPSPSPSRPPPCRVPHPSPLSSASKEFGLWLRTSPIRMHPFSRA